MQRSFKFIYVLCFLSGWAGLTWELLWFHHAGLAIGVSAKASAIVLISVMLGISFGSILAGRIYRYWQNYDPFNLYAILELLIGVCGSLIVFGFDLLQWMDGWFYMRLPAITPTLDFLVIILLLILPTTAMGATIAVFAKIADCFEISISGLYSANVAGAAFGVLATSFIFIPLFGVQMTTGITSCINIIVALVLALSTMNDNQPLVVKRDAESITEDDSLPTFNQIFRVGLVVFFTGFVTFNLEVSWFRSLRAAFQATTESFALMLSAVLIGLTLGAVVSSKIRLSRKISLASVLLTAAGLVFLSTPFIERIDLMIPLIKHHDYFVYTIYRSLLCLFLLGIPATAIGVALPWVIDEYHHTKSVAILYAINTLGAVGGSLSASWLLLPNVGFAKSAWIAGLALIAPVFLMKIREKRMMLLFPLAGLIIAIGFESGVGRLRFQNPYKETFKHSKLIDNQEGPDSTVTVIERADGVRDLIIDGFSASCNSKNANYMAWMGRLPMLFHPNPKQALVICFGTGQTANGVLQEGPQAIDIVDISQAVFNMAPHFQQVNHNVLDDPRVTHIVMDGRIWMQRTKRKYDVITLEPMPPTFSGTNSLYCKEFYELCYSKLSEGGMMAQWLPLHLVSPYEAASIVRTFAYIFPNCRLWIDPVSYTGIILGKKSAPEAANQKWVLYGLNRPSKGRNLNATEIERALAFDGQRLKPFYQIGFIITDDNQYLAYGYGRTQFNFINMQKLNFHIIEKLVGIKIRDYGVIF